ncbi:hypothetical protein [Flavobacterium sp.]|uniref:hypothetical protein n=1 Tax=Flavobacterium sp. TaxID=239 RepID=UPI0037BF526D
MKNETLFYYGLICLVAGVFCLILSKINPNPILGISGWIKPFKFCISTAIMAWTMGYYMQFLSNQNQVSIYNWSLIILLSTEIILIIFQASRGKISHFNQEDATGVMIFSTMALAVTIFMLHTAYIAILFFTQEKFAASEILIFAIQLSLIITVVFAFEGFAMGSLMKHTVGAEDGNAGLPIVNWNKSYGDLRVAHFFGMHALQLIPIASVLIAKNKRDVIIIALVYFAFVTFTLVQAFMAKPFIKL